MNFPYAPIGDTRLKKWKYEAEAKYMAQFIEEGSTVYDIGANIADHSIYFSSIKGVKIFAFEPVPEYFELAKKNIEFFNVDNVFIYNYGISNNSGEMKIAKENEGSSFLETRKNKNNTSTVKVKTIDELVDAGLTPPNVIKIDIEGWAEFAFLGMKKTLSKYKPIIILEPHPNFLTMEKLESKFKVVQGLGYRITSSVNNKNREFILECKTGKSFNDLKVIFNKQILDYKAQDIRNKYDFSISKSELKSLENRYDKLHSQGKVSLSKRLIWSKLYRFSTFKWLKTK